MHHSICNNAPPVYHYRPLNFNLDLDLPQELLNAAGPYVNVVLPLLVSVYALLLIGIHDEDPHIALRMSRVSPNN